MKKFFTLAAAAIMTASAYADNIETAFINTDLIGYDDQGKTKEVTLAAETEVAKSTNVTMYVAYADKYKLSSLTGKDDVANTIKIGNTEIPVSEHDGMQGSGNPAPNSIGELTEEIDDGVTYKYYQGGQTSGAVYRFDVKADGFLFVFQKATYNKNYFAWFGNANLGKGILMAVRHIGQPVTESGGSKYDYTMPEDENGMGYAAGDITSVIKVQKTVLIDGVATKVWLDADGNEVYTEAEAAKGTDGKAVQAKVEQTSLKQLTELLPADNFKSGTALSVIALPVYGGQWYINACGSKMTANGFAFVPVDNEEDLTMEKLNEIAVTFSKKEETAVAGIAEAKSEAKAPVKVFTANGIKIGNYNIAGQQVK